MVRFAAMSNARDLTGLKQGLGEEGWALPPALLGLAWLAWAGPGWADPSGLVIIFGGLVAGHDLAARRIPNALTAIIALTGLIWSLARGGPAGGGEALLAGLIGGGLLAVFFFLGLVGAGDVKALGALSIFLSPGGAVTLFILTLLCGGALALGRLAVAVIRREICPTVLVAGGGPLGTRVGPTGLTLPYGLAIWAGAVWLAAQGGFR